MDVFSTPVHTENDPTSLKLSIQGMDCANCALTLERSVAQLDGVDEVNVSFTTASLAAKGTATQEQIEKRVRALGYQVVEDEQILSKSTSVGSARAGVIGFFQFLLADTNTKLVLFAAGTLVFSGILSILSPSSWVDMLVTGFHVAIIIAAGAHIALKGVRSLVVGRQVTIDLLMTIATVGALVIGETGEGAMVIVLFAFGEALEGYTAERARDSLRSLMSLSPEMATVVRPCMDCQEHLGEPLPDSSGNYEGGPCPFCGMHETRIPVEDVAVGEKVVVRPGDRIPVDGKVLAGTSAVDESPITGESIPVIRQPDDEVYAGTINREGVLELSVTRPASNSTIARIVRLVEQAQSRRSPAERFIDRFARWYTPSVVVLAVIVAVVPPLIWGEPFIDPLNPSNGWLYRALALLIVACPCALVISTPVTVVSALTSLARRGVLIKGGVFLDVLSRLKVIAFDKTGTLTAGHPTVSSIVTPDCSCNGATCEPCKDLLALAASVESRSEHPLAHAIVNEAQLQGVNTKYEPAESITSLAGRGVKGVQEGKIVTIGSHSLFHSMGCDPQNGLHDQIEQAEQEGNTVMVIGHGDKPIGFISVSDPPRSSSRDVLRDLRRIDPSLGMVMLTGDNPSVAASVANQIGVFDEVHAGLLPEDKVKAVNNLRERYGLVAMLGDGINDAPALAESSVGIAMGGAGTAQAMETADVVLMQDDLSRLPDALTTSKRTQSIVQQNIILSLGIKVIFLLLAIPGLATLWMAVFADMGASLIVTLNGMRMLRKPDLED